jgi:hypothetical protein
MENQALKALFCSRYRCASLFPLMLLLSACGGGGGGFDNVTPQAPNAPPPGGTVSITGKVTFDRIPFDTQPGQGLNPNGIVEAPARGVVIEAIGAVAGEVVASGETDAAGNFTLAVPADTSLQLRAKAQMLKAGAAPTWNVRVLNNTNEDALFAIDGSRFNSGNANSVRNLRAPSGWGTSGYTDVRAAAPFAILDTVYRAQQLILSADGTAQFPALNVYWSSANKPTITSLCIDTGDLGSTFYSTGGSDSSECNGEVPEGIYVLGDFTQGDTDEFDQHVIAHEFGHYVEAKFSRSDSLGGAHREGDKLDLRVAFGEGWGNAFSGMVMNDPVYRDSFGGMASDFDVDMETDDTRFGDGGWYSEASIGEILWDAFDSTADAGDTVALGFAPLFATLRGGQSATDALTSIFSFLAALQGEVSASSAAIAQLRSGESITGTDAFGTGETNDGGDTSALPVYRPLVLNDPQQRVCVRASNGVDKLGYSKFFRLTLGANSSVTLHAVGAVDPGTPGSMAAADPDIFVYRRGAIVAAGTTDGSATEMISQQSLTAGTYIVEVFDFGFTGAGAHCMTISASGT